tara:strand:+ start:1 stop:1023 length:1023 start_codon:yes stop_codon:yes gene_type:complete
MRYVNKFGAKATKAKQAQSRLRALEKLDLVDAVISERSITFTFPQPKNLGSSMLLINQVEVGYNKSPVLKDINLSISNDSRIALVGANGNGKSTLIKLIYGNITPMSGQIIRNKKLKIGYFAQHQTDELDVTKTAYEIISDLDKEKPDLFLRGVLGRFGFDKEKSETLVEKLSGGEKTRLLFCIMSYHSPDLLLLDEPTNHLDIDSRISLINSLNAFEGAIILVSHDNDIIEKVTDQILVVSDGKVESFSEDLLNYKLYIKDQFDPTKNKNKNKSSNKKIKKIETEINKLVLKKEEIEIEMSLPKNLDKFETLSNLSDEYQLINKEIKKLENDWINENAQ